MRPSVRTSIEKISSGGVITDGDKSNNGGQTLSPQGFGLGSPAVAMDNFPGGDALWEVFTRFQRLQESFSVQLQVRGRGMLMGTCSGVGNMFRCRGHIKEEGYVEGRGHVKEGAC